jgi:uracil-DNA glycosylase family 4
MDARVFCEQAGSDEDELGRPFVGRSSILQTLAQFGKTEAVFITNIVICFPKPQTFQDELMRAYPPVAKPIC